MLQFGDVIIILAPVVPDVVKIRQRALGRPVLATEAAHGAEAFFVALAVGADPMDSAGLAACVAAITAMGLVGR